MYMVMKVFKTKFVTKMFGNKRIYIYKLVKKYKKL